MMEFVLSMSLITTIVVIFSLIEALKSSDKMYFLFFVASIVMVYADIFFIKGLLGI